MRATGTSHASVRTRAAGFVVGGAMAGFFMAVAAVDYFWIANVIYLGFVLWGRGSARCFALVAYRRGLCVTVATEQPTRIHQPDPRAAVSATTR